MFEEAKRLYDRAESHNDQLGLFENQRSDTKPHYLRNTLIALAAIAILVVLVIVF